MSLTDSELQAIRYHLGYVNLDVAAEPYFGIAAFFTQVLQPYLLTGAVTTSSTPVVATGTPTPTSIVLASASDIAVGDVLVVDSDARQERATLQSLAGTTATLQLSLAHGPGSYAVVVEGAEAIIRDILRELRLLMSGMNGSASAMSSVRSRVGIKSVIGEVDFFGGGTSMGSQGVDPLTQLIQLRELYRDELASAIGIERLNRASASGGSNLALC